MAPEETLNDLNEEDLPPLLLTEENGADPDAPEEASEVLILDDNTENTNNEADKERPDDPAAPAADGGAEPPKKKRHIVRRILTVLIILALLGGAGWYMYPRYIAPMLNGAGAVTEGVPAEDPSEEEVSAEAEEPAEEPETVPEEASAEPAETAEEVSAEELPEETEETAEESGEMSAEEAEGPAEDADSEESGPAPGKQGQRDEIIPEPVIIDRSGEKLPCAEILSLKMSRGADKVLCTPTIGGIAYDGESEELTLTGAKSVSAADVRAAFLLFPQLKRIVIPDNSGISFDPDELCEINLRMAEQRIVWTVHFAGYTLQTDIDYFCCNDGKWGDTDELTTENIAPLRYCTDMVDLDLGHSDGITSAYFVSNMKHLKYLIIADTQISDLSPLANCHDLYFLEVFMDPITGIEPLTGLTNLRYLNIGYTFWYDVTPLEQMVWLDYLWYSGNILDTATKEELTAALPATNVYLVRLDGHGSTGNGWRETEGYYEMRDGLHMYYMDG